MVHEIRVTSASSQGSIQYIITFFCSTLISLAGAELASKSTSFSDLKSRNQSKDIRLSLAVAIGATVSKNDTIDDGHSKSNEEVITMSCKWFIRILIYTEVGDGFRADASKFLTIITIKTILASIIPEILRIFKFGSGHFPHSLSPDLL